MNKLVTENPKTIIEHMHNFVFVKNKEVFVKIGEEEISLIQYIRKMDYEIYGIKHDAKYCNPLDFGEYMDDDRFTCNMYNALVGFAEVREELKKYEEKLKDTTKKESKRDYVVISNEYKGIGGSLVFWGRYTEDNAKGRNFGGYRSDFASCEKYTLEELKQSGYNFPIYGKEVNHDNWRKFENFAIEIKRLKRLGYRPLTIYYKV